MANAEQTQPAATGAVTQQVGLSTGTTIGQITTSGQINFYVIQGKPDLEPESEAPESPLGPNPYRGLAAFQEGDSDRFFGRDRTIDDLWQRMADLHSQPAVRLLPLYGPSGSGKSSLALAGLVPRLAQQPLLGYERARYVRLVPDDDPVTRLAGALAWALTDDALAVEKTQEIARTLQQPNEKGQYSGLRLTANLFLDNRGSPLIVLIDQFEEVFAQCKQPEQQRIFIENLLCAAASPSGSLWLLVTLRSDFLGETQRYPALNQVFSQQGYLVPALTRAELEEAIAKPAEQAGHRLDASTVKLLVEQTEGRAGALPLLQFALTRLWEGLQRGEEPAQTLAAIGGVGGALANQAQAIYDRCNDAEKTIARRVFLGLIHLGEGAQDTRRRVSLDGLVAHHEDKAQVRSVVARFASREARLITVSGDGVGGVETVEVTHEALIDHWQLLRQWLDEGRDDLRFQRRLEEAAQHWETHGRAEGSLWRSPDLELLRTFHARAATDMTALQLQFYQAAVEAEVRQDREKQLQRRRLVGALSAGLVVSSGLGIFAWVNAQAANAQRRMAQDQALSSDIETRSLTIENLLSSQRNKSAFWSALELGRRIQALDSRANAQSGALNKELLSAEELPLNAVSSSTPGSLIFE